MAKTGSARELLIVALQDLNDAEHALVERLPCFAQDISHGLAAYLVEESERATRQSVRLEDALERLGAAPIDAPNIWLRAILDDAARDYETIVPGVLRDIALVGALRKAKQAERVSYETAAGLARATGNLRLETGLLLCREEEAAGDAALALLLQHLLSPLSA